jgi:hypothetical protein
MATAVNQVVENPPQTPSGSALTLDAFCRERGCHDGIAVASLEAGTVLSVVTRHTTYRLILLNPGERRVLISGGNLFTEPTELRVEGASTGGSALKLGWIGVGLRLELALGRRWISTSPVSSVTIEALPSASPSRFTV